MEAEREEIRLLPMLRELWRGRHIIIFSAFVGAVVAAFVVLLTPKEYTARCEFIQQSSSTNISPRITSLASLAGITLPSLEQVEVLPASLYENIVFSEPFLEELIHYPLYFESCGREYTLLEYLAQDKESDRGLREWIKSQRQRRQSPTGGRRLSEEEYEAVKYLHSHICVEYDVADGYVSVETTLPAAVAAAELAECVVRDLENRVIELKIERVKSNMLFIEARYEDAKENLDSLQRVRARYMDANRNISTHSAMTTLERIDTEYNLARGLYEELAIQLEQARIQVREQTPILSIFSPVTVPFKPSKPRRMIIFITFVASGFIVGAVVVFTMRAIAELRGDVPPTRKEEYDAKNQ